MEKTKEYRKELAELFLRVLEEKNLDWKKEWRGKGVPVNAKRNVSYKGINRFRLMIVCHAARLWGSQVGDLPSGPGYGMSAKECKRPGCAGGILVPI